MGDFDFGGLVGGLGSLVGGIFQSDAAKNVAAQNIQEQNYLASNAISLRVADAARAGINPLTAMGAGTPSFSPTPADAGLGQGIAGMGQGIGRAISQMTDEDSKAAQMSRQLDALKIEQAKNDVTFGQLRNSQLARSIVGTQTLPNSSVIEENFRGPKGTPIYSPMYDPITGKTVMFPTRDASARSFGSLGEPTARVLGDVSAATNAAAALSSSKFDFGANMTGPVTVRPDVLRDGKLQGQYPYGDYPFIGN